MMGLPGETEESIKRTSDFIISLGLDDMTWPNSRLSPGAPLWSTIKDEGAFNEDWRLMNCLNFVFVPKGIASEERLDQLYNEHVKCFYSDKIGREKFRKRNWQHRKSLMYLLRHLPAFWSAKNQLEQTKLTYHWGGIRISKLLLFITHRETFPGRTFLMIDSALKEC